MRLRSDFRLMLMFLLFIIVYAFIITAGKDFVNQTTINKTRVDVNNFSNCNKNITDLDCKYNLSIDDKS